MTCREKLKLEHPEKISLCCMGGCSGCPDTYGYLNREDALCPRERLGDDDRCTTCWDQEIPEEREAIRGQRAQTNILDDAIDDSVPKEVIEKVVAPFKQDSIKDSGDRTEFSTGAVRDMREGKGRCDLMPLDVVARILANHILVSIASFQKSGQVYYLYDTLKYGAMFGTPEDMFLEVAKHFEEGAKKYGESNWQKGIPVNCYIDSAVRHYLKFLRGDTDERHDRAFVWNILCCIWTVENMPELNNYRKETK